MTTPTPLEESFVWPPARDADLDRLEREISFRAVQLSYLPFVSCAALRRLAQHCRDEMKDPLQLSLAECLRALPERCRDALDED